MSSVVGDTEGCSCNELLLLLLLLLLLPRLFFLFPPVITEINYYFDIYILLI